MATRTRRSLGGRLVHQERPVAGGTGWKASAACRGAPSDQFDPLPGFEGYDVPVDARWAALAYCADCPVRAECNREANTHRYEGLYGGFFRIRRPYPGHSLIKKVNLLEEA